MLGDPHSLISPQTQLFPGPALSLGPGARPCMSPQLCCPAMCCQGSSGREAACSNGASDGLSWVWRGGGTGGTRKGHRSQVGMGRVTGAAQGGGHREPPPRPGMQEPQRATPPRPGSLTPVPLSESDVTRPAGGLSSSPGKPLREVAAKTLRESLGLLQCWEHPSPAPHLSPRALASRGGSNATSLRPGDEAHWQAPPVLRALSSYKRDTGHALGSE